MLRWATRAAQSKAQVLPFRVARSLLGCGCSSTSYRTIGLVDKSSTIVPTWGCCISWTALRRRFVPTAALEKASYGATTESPFTNGLFEVLILLLGIFGSCVLCSNGWRIPDLSRSENNTQETPLQPQACSVEPSYTPLFHANLPTTLDARHSLKKSLAA